MPDLFGYSTYEGLSRSAEISDCGRYRWWLRRSWKYGGNGRTVCFIMLNPSTADALVDDPTVRRCMGFTRAWGFSGLSVRNLFPFRATDPAELLTANDPGGGNKGLLELMAGFTADLTIAAWGSGTPFGRDREAMELFPGRDLYCLGITKHGHPRHPLYVRGDCRPILFIAGKGPPGPSPAPGAG
jgi:hypothetical protein